MSLTALQLLCAQPQLLYLWQRPPTVCDITYRIRINSVLSVPESHRCFALTLLPWNRRLTTKGTAFFVDSSGRSKLTPVFLEITLLPQWPAYTLSLSNMLSPQDTFEDGNFPFSNGSQPYLEINDGRYGSIQSASLFSLVIDPKISSSSSSNLFSLPQADLQGP